MSALPDREPAALSGRRDEERDGFDLVTDVLLPATLFAMVGALLWFLIDVQSAVSGGPTKLLRWVFFFFALAIVGIARIKAVEGSTSAVLFAMALMGVMGLFGWLYSFGGGAFGGGFGGQNPVGSLLMIYAIIGFVGWAAFFIVDRTAISADDITVQESGLLTSDEWERQGARASAVRRRPHPGRAVMVLSLVAVLIFGAGHKAVAGNPEFALHAFWCMVLYALGAVSTLAMTALTGLQLYVRQRGARTPAALPVMWLSIALPIAVALVGLAVFSPRLQPQPGSWSPHVVMGDFGETDLNSSPVEGMRQSKGPGGATSQSGSERSQSRSGPMSQGKGGQGPSADSKSTGKGTEPGQGKAQGSKGGAGGQGGAGQGGQNGKGGEEQKGAEQTKSDAQKQGTEPDKSGKQAPSGDKSGDEGQKQSGEQSQQEQQQAGAEKTKDDPDKQGQAESQDAQKQQPSDPAKQQQQPKSDSGKTKDGDTGKSDEKSAETAKQDVTPASPTPPAGDLMGTVVKIIGALIALALVALIVWRILGAGWWGRLRGLLRRSPDAAAPEPAKPRRNPFVDPFGPRSPVKREPPAEHVRYVYRGFQAWAEMAGCPRGADTTAREFLYELPPSTASWRPEIERLTALYEAAEYTPDSVDESCFDDLKLFWGRLMEAVGRLRT